jgi:hypothetical protein
LSKRKKRQKREAKQIMKIIERLNIPVLPWGTTERYSKQIEEEAMKLVFCRL